MGPLSRNEWVMSGLVVLAMFLWITGSNPNIKLPFLGANYMNATMVVLVIISLLLVTKVVRGLATSLPRSPPGKCVLLFHLAAHPWPRG